ncbi:MAG: LapA family protein [Candidatus Omnitrophica bacterium]|nr:LapA family protein [Candidatus Omnitrophota bacterium]
MSRQWIIILALLSLTVIFTVQNYEIVRIRFLIWSFETSRAIVIFSSLFAGIAIGFIISYMHKRRN